ncbi:hypothetical protein OG455_04890 [Kitasatospora sp. NBC_01287]|uniref:hypothetical protein n=1 Tax=Kitasatospora sp. NBC_01287 TaxID=2903573 RepID=UPI00225B3884|nr:hypothetical protein [Kitasatospora sp. NBC_01287]MCX4744862.1 hypothetical protein [Kitasatospora sp. NBC_01287]
MGFMRQLPGAARRIPTLLIGLGLASSSFCLAGAPTAYANTATPGTTSAGLWHNYAIGFDTSHGPYYGIGVSRNDTYIPVGPASDCTTSAFSPPVVYQTQWVLMTSDAQNWEELGTSHRCNYHDFWYYGYGLSGAWYPVGTRNEQYIGSPARHRFSIWRDGSNTWHYEVDSTDLGTDYWATSGAQISFGLESYDPSASTVGTDYAGISFLNSAGGSTSISGQGGVDIGTNMCGTWSANNTTWWAGEGSGCGFGSAARTQSSTVQGTPAAADSSQAALPIAGPLRAGGGLSTAAVATSCASTAKYGAAVWGTTGAVTSAYGSTAKAVNAWKSRDLARKGKELSPAQADADGPVAVCVISGTYAIPAPLPAGGSADQAAGYDLAVVTVDSHGKVTPFAYGNAITLADLLTPPPAG